MLDAMGIETGIDIEKLLAVTEKVQSFIPNESIYGFTKDSGLPKGYEKGWGIVRG
jgi:hydroxymethylglutaryl-CoA lyase